MWRLASDTTVIVAAFSGVLITALVTFGSGNSFTDGSHISSAKFECVVNIYLAPDIQLFLKLGDKALSFLVYNF